MQKEGAINSRREQILEIETHLFQRGFRATSLDHVAAETGVTRPALYYYFRSKEELLAAIHDRAVGVLIVRVYFQERDSLGEVASRSVKAKAVAFTKMMASAIKAGQSKGMFRPGDPELIVNAILGMLIWVHKWYRPERHREEDIGAMFWQLLAGGLLTAPLSEAIAPSKTKTRSTTRKVRLRVVET